MARSRIPSGVAAGTSTVLRKSGNGQNRRTRLHVLEIVGNGIMGGMERYVEMLVRRLPPEHFRITCLVPFEGPFTALLHSLNCTVWITPMEDDPPWRSIQFAAELIRQQQVDLVHVHWARAHALGGIAGAITGRPVVATMHTMNIPNQELGVCRTTHTHLITVCQAAYAQALALGVPLDQLTLIPNGVDPTLYRPAAGGDTFRAAIGVPPDAPLVGFVGRLANEKGPDHFVRAAEFVRRTRPDAHFVLVGDGLMERELRDMVDRMQLREYVHFAGPWTAIADVYPALDLYVQPSRSEGLPLALLEAMACARPVAAMAVGGVPEVIEHGITGLMVGPGDWIGLGGMIAGMLSDPERLRSMGLHGRQRVESHFNLATTIERTAALFEHLTETTQQPRAEHAVLAAGK